MVGNAFPHKNLLPTVRRLRERLPDVPVTVLGVGRPAEPGLTWFRSGDLTPAEVNGLYEQAGVVVYPSFYEGFGLPIMHALARGRPVLALDLPVYREIQAASRSGGDIHLFATTDALVTSVPRLLASSPHPAREGVEEQRWSDAAQAITRAVSAAISAFSPIYLRARLLDSLERAQSPPFDPDESTAMTDEAPSAPAGGNRLLPGQCLLRGARLLSSAGGHALHLQSDGNLVLYAAPQGTPHLALWATGENPTAEALVLGEDGGLELRDGAGAALWRVQGRPGGWLEVRPGALVLADGEGVAWEVPDRSDRRVQPAYQRSPGTLYSGGALPAGHGLTSRGGHHHLSVGPAGLTIRSTMPGEGETWSVRTDPAPTRLVMQEDGNLVAYAADGRAVWSSGTNEREGVWARLSDEGVLVVEQADGVLWSSSDRP